MDLPEDKITNYYNYPDGGKCFILAVERVISKIEGKRILEIGSG